jgi:hypothetical protein
LEGEIVVVAADLTASHGSLLEPEQHLSTKEAWPRPGGIASGSVDPRQTTSSSVNPTFRVTCQ